MNVLMKTGVIAAVAVWALSPGSALAQDHADHDHGAEGHKQQVDQPVSKLPVCPVMGDPIDFSIKMMTDDGPVYMCCEGCIKKATKNPDKYAKKFAAQREMLKKMDRVQVNCPVSGEAIDGKTFAMIGGKGVSFCCEDCVAKYEKDPAKYAAKLEGSYSYQTMCPVSNEKIDPTSFADLPTGQRVYFCCDGCDKKFTANPGKYAPKLAEQGVNVDLKKLAGAKAKPHDDGHDHDHP